MPVTRNEDGLVALTVDRKMSEVCDNQQGIVDTLQRIIIGTNQSTFVCVDGIRPLLDNKYVDVQSDSCSVVMVMELVVEVFGQVIHIL